MCAVSMISDHYMQKWPTIHPAFNPVPPTMFITKEQWDEYQELKRKAMEYDKANKQEDCVKPEVDAWEKQLTAYMKSIGIIKT